MLPPEVEEALAFIEAHRGDECYPQPLTTRAKHGEILAAYIRQQEARTHNEPVCPACNNKIAFCQICGSRLEVE